MPNTDTSPSQPFVSVLMPVYNAGSFIGEAIYSLLGQTYPFFEIILIDDHSTDHSVEIIGSFNDPRLRLFRNDRNMGITASLNKGLSLAQHELIARMDADDICHPLRLEKQVAYMMAHPDCAMVSTWVRIINEEGQYIRTEGTRQQYLYYNLFFECCIYHPTIMLRKTLLEKAGNYRLPYAEDFELFQRISRQFRIGGIDEPLLDYRVHHANTNTVGRKTEYDDFSLRILKDNIRYCLGDKAPVPPLAYLECYRYNHRLLTATPGLKKIYGCLDQLDKISAAILQMPNPNNRSKDILFIWRFKKDYIIRQLSAYLSPLQKIRLGFKYRKFSLVIPYKLRRAISLLINRT